MKKATYRFMLTLLVFALVVAGLPMAAFAEAGEEPIELTLFMGEKGNVIDFNTNFQAKWLEEQTGIKMTYIGGEEDAEDKINLMLSSGEGLPDIVQFELSNAQQIMYGGEGMIIPVNAYIEKSTYMKQMLEEYPDLVSMITMPDGNIYGLPKFEFCYQCQYSQKMWVNEKWMETLGIDTPTTTDEFRDMLRRFRDEDPNGNGLADEVPYAAATDGWHSQLEKFLMNAFVYNNGNDRLFLDGGKVQAAYATDGWRDGIRYLKGMYDEGLIDPESLVQDCSQAMQLVENGEANLLGAFPGGGSFNFCSTEGDHIADYGTIAPLTGPSGFSAAAYYAPDLSNRVFITKDCKNPEAAFLWLDFLLSEEATMVQIAGEPGVDWRLSEEGELDSNGEQARYTYINNVVEEPEQNQCFEIVVNVSENLSEHNAVAPGTVVKMRDLDEETKRNYEGREPRDMILPPLVLDIDDSIKIGEVGGELARYVENCFAMFIVGDMDIEADWDGYTAELQRIGLDGYLQIMQSAYDKLA